MAKTKTPKADLTTRQGRLEAVVEDLEQFRAEWDSLGRPMFAKGCAGQDVPHPILRLSD